MMSLQETAYQLISQWKSGVYTFGYNIVKKSFVFPVRDKKIHLIIGKACQNTPFFSDLKASLDASDNTIVAQTTGSAPNSPINDVERVAHEIKNSGAQLIVSIGGGSVIDAVKASIVLACYGGSVEDYFGNGLVSAKAEQMQHSMLPHIAIMTASASSAHLTKYSNVTNPVTNQKKLIIDPLIAPQHAIFDYAVTGTMPALFTKTGAWDGIGHLSEVYYGVDERDASFEKMEKIVLCGIELILEGINAFKKDPLSQKCRESLGLGTDLGGHTIMFGSTSGPHLNSFSLVDLVDHGMAVAIMQPYYGAFYAPAIPEKLKKLCRIYKKFGYIDSESFENASAEQIGKIYAQGLINFSKSIDFPTQLNQIQGFSSHHVERMLAAAKNPQLDSKLKAMPVPMDASTVETLMRPIINNAIEGII